jgi:hypothetical protein
MEVNTTMLGIFAVFAVIGLVGVVAVTIMSVPEDAEGKCAAGGTGFNASKGRCFQ